MLFVNHTRKRSLILQENKKATAHAVAFLLLPEGLVVAAATENNNYCKDYNPSAVIVEKMA